jgi:hypothetical protein
MSDVIYSEFDFDPKIKNYSVEKRSFNGKNQVSFQFGKGEHLTLDETGNFTMLNASNHRNLINDVVRRGYLAGVNLNGEIVLFSNQGNTLIKNILEGTADSSKVDIENEINFNLSSILTLKDCSTNVGETFRDNSISTLDLTISFPDFKSYARVFEGKLTLNLDKEEKDNIDVTQKINEEILKLKENGLICDIPTFSLSKPQSEATPTVPSSSRFPFLAIPAISKYRIEWPNKPSSEFQTIVNIIHPEIRKLIF